MTKSNTEGLGADGGGPMSPSTDDLFKRLINTVLGTVIDDGAVPPFYISVIGRDGHMSYLRIDEDDEVEILVRHPTGSVELCLPLNMFLVDAKRQHYHFNVPVNEIVH